MTLRQISLAVSLGMIFFLITATTFASLGVILPAMIAEFGWSWTTAGLGFTVLALLTGVFSPIAAKSLERLGARLHYAVGGIIMTAGYLLLAAATDVVSYLAATALLGAGFALLANVTGAYLVGRAAPPAWRTIAIGAYLSAGGAGGVFGPLIANAIITTGADWRLFWTASALAAACVSAVIVLLTGEASLRAAGADPQDGASEDNAAETARWTASAAMKTPAFMAIAAALTIAYFCGVTVSTWSVTHLQNLGFGSSVAVAMLSLYSGSNAGARALGGIAARRIDAKTLLVAALLANAIGMTALAFATSLPVAIAFALFDGFAFGMALFATTVLMIEYFGLKNSPALLGSANLLATIAMAGPTIAGKTADLYGDFAPIFIVYALAALTVAVAVLMIANPNGAAATAPEPI